MAGKGGSNLLLFVLYVLLGLYLLNFGLNFIKIPDFLLKIERWIIFVGGALIIFSSFRLLKGRRTQVR